MFTATVFLILLSGSAFGSSFIGKRFEEILPITCMSISAILFIFGLFGKLKSGFYAVLISALLILIISLFNTFRHKDFKRFAKNFFTPSFFLFAVLLVTLTYFYYGKLASAWDEFSHWVDSVKAMYQLDDFVTNKNSYSMFKSYPPAMTLFEYFFTKLSSIVHRNSDFEENRVYIAYQVFTLSFFFPLLKNFSPKRTLRYIAVATVLFLTPLFFFNTFLSQVYIDPFVAIMSGCAISAILLNDKFDVTFNIYIALTSFTLVLAKDVGFYFAIFVFICYAIRCFAFTQLSFTKKVLFSITPLLTALLAKVLWKIELLTSKTEVLFGGKIDLVEYSKIFYFHGDSSYKKSSVENFKTAFFTGRHTIGDFDIKISYFNLAVILIFSLIIICYLYKKTNNSKKQIGLKLIVTAVIVQTVMYIYSLGATYISNFSEYEAVNLASYQRYMNIAFLSAYIIAVSLLLNYFDRFKSNGAYLCVFVAVLILLTPLSKVKMFFNMEDVRNSANMRANYDEILYDIDINCERNARIYFVSQKDSGLNYHITKFSARPRIIDNLYAWSIGDGPLYEGDIWTKTMTPEEFVIALQNGNYGYVAIYSADEQFTLKYGSLFEDKSQIESNSLFKFDKQAKLLKRVDK